MKKVILLATNGFEEIEALTVVDVLRRAGAVCDICAVMNTPYLEGSHGIVVKADCKLEEMGTPEELAVAYDAVVLPGGMPGSELLKNHDGVIAVLQAFAKADKVTAAICAAPIALERAGLLQGKTCTVYPGCLSASPAYNLTDAPVEHDGNVITGKAPGAALPFAYELVRTLVGESAAKAQKESMFA